MKPEDEETLRWIIKILTYFITFVAGFALCDWGYEIGLNTFTIGL